MQKEYADVPVSPSAYSDCSAEGSQDDSMSASSSCGSVTSPGLVFNNCNVTIFDKYICMESPSEERRFFHSASLFHRERNQRNVYQQNGGNESFISDKFVISRQYCSGC